MGVTAYSWLTLATIASCALALAGGAALGRVGGRAWRISGTILLVGVVGGLAWAGYGVWKEFGMEYPPNYLRAGMGGLALLIALLGLAVGRGARGLSYFAAFALLVSAAGSAVGVYMWVLCGAITSEELPVTLVLFMALIFTVHSFWGWALLPLTARLGR
jgi:hypothetical protein